MFRKGMVAIYFHLHSELNILMDTISMVKETFQLLGSMASDDKLTPWSRFFFWEAKNR
jgi:hypothetical protein